MPDKTSMEKFEYVPCDICGSENWENAGSMQDKSYGVPGRFSIVRCKLCGLLYTNPRPKAKQLSDLYNPYYGEENPQNEDLSKPEPFIKRHKKLRSLYHWVCGQYLTEILSKAKGRVLDVGCGNGDLLSELIEMECDCFGLEPNPKAVQTCVRKGLKIEQGTLDQFDLPINFFDTVILWHVIEHLPSPKKALKSIYKILKDKGSLFVYCPNADSYMSRFFNENWRGWHLPFHFYHFTPDTFNRLLTTTGFKTYSIKTVTPDFIFSESLKNCFKDRGCVQKWIIKNGLFNSFTFRVVSGFFFRFLDVSLRMQGECLRVELRKD